LVVSLVIVLFVTFAAVNRRTCELGLSSCIPVFESRAQAHYIASRNLEKNALLAAADLKLWIEWPPGAKKYAPAAIDLAGKYLKGKVVEGETIKDSQVSAEPAPMARPHLC
jgi:hypothetical protein